MFAPIHTASTFLGCFNQTAAMFATPASQGFMQQLTGRDCTGETQGSPSWYQAGDHSLPHTDWVGQRTVAYVWHLSKDWRPRSGSIHASKGKFGETGKVEA